MTYPLKNGLCERYLTVPYKYSLNKTQRGKLNREGKEQQKKQFIADFERGKRPGGNTDVSKVIRKHLLEKAGNACTLCGYNGINGQGKPNLEISHIDHDPYNHHVLNLEVICPNCHGEKTIVKRKGGRGHHVRRPEYNITEEKVGESEAKYNYVGRGVMRRPNAEVKEEKDGKS